MRHQGLCRQERQTRPHRGRRERPDHSGPPVPEVPRAEGLRLQPAPRGLSHEAPARQDRRRRRLGALQLGRGPRPHHGQVGRDHRQVRPQDDGDPRWHGPRRHALPGLPALHLPHAQPGLHAVRLRMLPAAHDGLPDGAGRPVPRARLRWRPRGRLRSVRSTRFPS